MDNRALVKEIGRKAFHLTAIIYVIGAVYLPRPTYIAILLLGLAGALVFDFIRLRKPGLNDLFCRMFGGLIRESERDRLTGATWLLGGVLAAAIIAKPLPIFVTVLLYLILGDTAASLVGIRIGGTTWPGIKKTVVGSATCFLTCLWIGSITLRPAYSWPGVILGAAVATVVEASLIRINDNFLIPACSAVAFWIIYGPW